MSRILSGTGYKYTLFCIKVVSAALKWLPLPPVDASRKITLMGIVNLTDDSYFAPSRVDISDGCAGLVRRVAAMKEEGADIIDMGACSTRPGSVPVDAAEEWRRLAPALKAVSVAFPGTAISVDTFRASVAGRAYDLIGDFMVNDISAGEADKDMLPLVGRLGLRYVAMHMRGTPETMQNLACYDDVTAEVASCFRSFALRAEDNGIADWILDPGFGFAKTVDQNYELLSNLEVFRGFGRPVLVGVSRKSMIYRLLGITPEEALPATQVVHFKALENGADILRVHDVAEAARTVALYRRLAHSSI